MNNVEYQHVAVFMGGFSTERDISLKSGKAVAKGLSEAGRDVIEIDLSGRHFELPALTQGVFIALHGEFGEDGEVQKMLEAVQIPYTGAGPASSKLAFNKDCAKHKLIEHGIPTPDFEVLRPGEKRSLPLPVFVKPVRQGSSLGVHKVTSESQWDAAFADALSYNGKVLVESCIEGKELTVGILNDTALPVLEIRAPSNNYDYRAKYTSGLTKYIVPAKLDERDSQECMELAMKTFNALKCRGLGRVDIKMAKDGAIWILELNTIPGFTETSLLPKAARAAGYDFASLCDKIMQTATLDNKTKTEQFAAGAL